MSVILHSKKRKEVDKNEKQDFYNKSFKAHCYHFITLCLTGISNKKIDTLQH